MAIDISNNASRITYALSAGASQAAFTASFEFFEDTDIKVYVDGVLKSISTHYSVSGGGGATGTVTFNSALTGITGGSQITLLRATVIERTTDFSSGTDINRAALNTQLDTLTAIAADNKGRAERALQVPDSEGTISVVLPSIADRKGTVLGFHETTGALAVGPNISAVQSVANVTTSINILGTAAAVEDMGILATAAIVEDMALLGTGGNVANMAKLATDAIVADMAILATDAIVADMAILATDDIVADMAILGTSDVVTDMNLLATAAVVEDMGLLATSAVIEDMGLLGTAAVIEDMGLLATSAVIEDMGLLATSAVIEDMGLLASSATVSNMAQLGTSAVVADLAILATSDVVSDMNTLGTSDIVTDMNTLATSANVTAMGLLGTSAVVEDMGLLSASAVIEDMGLLSAAAVIEDMGLLATSAVIEDMGLLATSAVIEDMGLLATSAVIEDIGILGTSANVTAMSNVSGAITNVNTVASNVAGVNSFAERYRVAGSAPSSSLDVGDLYFDTSANELKVYKSSGWAAAGSTVNGTSARFHYDITGTPTTVTGSDANSNTLAYDAGFIDVYVNGVRMSPADITTTSGSSVVFASALAAGDEVDIVAFGTFAVANIVATGALNSGSITSGFGTINNGASAITTTGVGSFGSLDISGAIDVDGVTNLDVVDIDGAVDMASTLAVAGVVTANAGVVVDNFTLDGTTLALSSGDLTVDVAGDINLDADGGDINLKDGGTAYGHLSNSSSDLFITNPTSDKDIHFRGSDSGSFISALTLDMSDAGAATFNGNATVSGGTLKIIDTELTEASDNFSINIQSGNNDFLVKSGGTTFASFKGFDGSKNFGTFSNGSGGFNLFVGSANTGSFALRLDGVGTSASNVVQFVNGNGQVGSITVSGTSTAYNTSSDHRLKENVVYDWDATTRLKQLKPARFNFIADADTTVDGFLAHEAQAVVPEAVTGAKDAVDDDGAAVMQGIDQSKIVPLLVKTIQELEARITALEG